MFTKKLWPALGLICISLLNVANAHITPEEKIAKCPSKIITPNAGPHVKNGADVFLTADFIFWKAVQEGTEYATSGIGLASNPNLVDVPRGKTESVGRDWSPGFKVGLGLNLNHDGWDLYAQYTWLHPSNSRSLSRTFDATAGTKVVSALPVWLSNFFVEGDRADAKWCLHFNVIDVELGRNYFLSQFFTMRPFIGLKATWQKQDLRYRYRVPNGIDIGAPQVLSGPYSIHFHNDVWGLGVRGGFNAAWYMSKQWSIYGDLAWTGMWSDYTKLSRKDKVGNATGVGNGNAPDLVNTRQDDHYSVKWIGEIEMGLRWEIWFYDDRYHFAIQAGWEQQVWLSWQAFENLTSSGSWQDLNFQGLNLKFRFDF